MHEVRQGFVSYEGFQLAYESHGADDGVPVLLMHGILLDAAVNRDLAGPLVEAGFRVILLDLLGHGRSDRADATELRNDFFAEQVVATLDQLGLEQAVIGGLSLGAIVALHVACLAPRRVRALLLEMPVMERSTVFAALLLTPIVVAVDYAAALYRPFARFLRRLPKPRRGLWESGLNAIAQEPEDIKAILHGILVGSVVPPRRQRRKIGVPTLVIGHEGDWLHNIDDATALSEEIPGARLIKAHSIFELRTKPGRLLPEIIGFLKESTGQKVVRLEPARGAAGADAPADLVAHFEAAVAKVRSAPQDGPMKPSNEYKLKMYALYRQAQDGDAHGKRPGMMDVVGRFKYDAWAALKGVSRHEAMQRYITEVDSVEKKFG